MNRRLIVIALATVIASGIGVFILYQYGSQKVAETPANAAGSTGTSSPQAEKSPLYWHDPMVPGPKFDKPGKSPFMDMQLVPVYADEGGADGGVTISARTQQNLGVRTAEVSMGALAPEIQTVGNVAWNERDTAIVPARATGYIEKLYVRATLDPVRKGQPLAEIYAPEWVAVQEEFLAIRHMRAEALGGGANIQNSLLDAALQRMRLAGMTDEQIRKVQAVGLVQPRIIVSAPLNGVLAELNVREGSAVNVGMPIARVSGLSTVWINAALPEAQASQLPAGTPVEARTAAGFTAQGRVNAVLPDVNAATRTLTVRVEMDNARRQLVPGMFATLNFKPAAHKDVLLIPSEAVIATGTRTIVMAARENGQFTPVEVEIGAESNGRTEIRKGLVAGERVVLSGQFLVDSEASLKGVAARQGTVLDRSLESDEKRTYNGRGTVEAIGNGNVTLSIDPVPELHWKSTTQRLQSPANGLPRNVEVGDSVGFVFRQDAAGQSTLTTITPIAPEPANTTQAVPHAAGEKP